MTNYSFKKEAQVYVIYGGSQYNIDISGINFSQTFLEESYKVKTLQTQAMFEGSIINKANPANFEFTFPALREDDLKVVFDRALDYLTFDLYVSTPEDIFFIEYCVITQSSFVVEKLKPLSMLVSGQASKITRVGVVPGTPVSRDVNRTYNRISDLNILLGGVTLISEDLASVTIELQNNIEWIPYTIGTGECGPSTTLMYPTAFTIKRRSLMGSITRYLTETNNTDLQNFNTNTSLHIEVGQSIGGTLYGFDLDMINCFFTNKVNTGEVYTQVYEWSLIQNPTNLSDIVTYITL